jgi:hypothetical protein
MRKFLLAAGALAAVVGATALPAGAVTPTSFTLEAGSVSISAPTGSVSLGTRTVSNGSMTISGPLGNVTVSDLRGGATSWTASVISSAFTGPFGVTPASNVSYAAGAFTQSGVAATASNASDLTGVSVVVTGASTGVSSATWNPTISVFIPANTEPGQYDATITHSVA